MCVYTYIYIYIYTHTYIHTYIYNKCTVSPLPSDPLQEREQLLVQSATAVHQAASWCMVFSSVSDCSLRQHVPLHV